MSPILTALAMQNKEQSVIMLTVEQDVIWRYKTLIGHVNIDHNNAFFELRVTASLPVRGTHKNSTDKCQSLFLH